MGHHSRVAASVVFNYTVTTTQVSWHPERVKREPAPFQYENPQLEKFSPKLEVEKLLKFRFLVTERGAICSCWRRAFDFSFWGLGLKVASVLGFEIEIYFYFADNAQRQITKP